MKTGIEESVEYNELIQHSSSIQNFLDTHSELLLSKSLISSELIVNMEGLVDRKELLTLVAPISGSHNRNGNVPIIEKMKDVVIVSL